MESGGRKVSACKRKTSSINYYLEALWCLTKELFYMLCWNELLYDIMKCRKLLEIEQEEALY